MTLTWLFLFDPLSYGIYFLFQSLGILYDLDSNRKARDIDLFFIIQWRPPPESLFLDIEQQHIILEHCPLLAWKLKLSKSS